MQRMRIGKATICILFTLLFLPLNAQIDQKEFKKTFLEAEYFFLTEEFEEAVFIYLELLKADPTNYNLKFLIGACYLSIYGKKDLAIPYLEDAVPNIVAGYREGSYKERNAPREALFALGRAYHINYQFDKAIEFYEMYRNAMLKKHFADIEYVNNQIKSCELAQAMIDRPIEVRFTALDEEVNRYPRNYNPVFSYNDSVLVYVADQPLHRAILVTERKSGGWTEPVDISKEIGSDGDCLPTSLSFDGKELYLVQSGPYESDVYVSRGINGRWSAMEPLNENINTNYFESHACISPGGTKLYFTSDRPGGQGGLDIYVSERTRDGEWQPAVNMGPKVNSFYNEETPFITANGRKLFFSSQGHPTMGGFDIFSVTRLPDGTWSYAQNIGYPVSTTDDDLFFVPRRNGASGYFSTIIDTLSENRNIYALQIGPDLDLQFQIGMRQAGEEEPEPEVEPEDTLYVGTVEVKDSVRRVSPDEYYMLHSIFFDFDDYSLNKEALDEVGRLLEVMTKNPELGVELTGHTDAKGADEYNIRLSNRRAQAVMDYLVLHGIESSRITVNGAGEAAPIALNEYEDGTDSPEGRRLNRHVSIKLTNLQHDNIFVADIFVPTYLRPKFEMSYSVLLVQSESFVDTMPDEFEGEQVALIITEDAYLYTAGNYHRKVEAMKLLNEAIDKGFNDARMLEKQDLEDLIRELSGEGLPVTITFTIQIMALENPVEVSYFTNLDGVRKFQGKDGLHRYVYGEFDSIDEALKRLPEIRDLGYTDAFIMYLARYRKM
jgi:outer membrane protein OmpA-like peptidoglycan-associated protein